MDKTKEVRAVFEEIPRSDVFFKLLAARPQKVNRSRIISVALVECRGNTSCQVTGANSKLRVRGKKQSSEVIFSRNPFTFVTEVKVKISRKAYRELRRGVKSGKLSISLSAKGTVAKKDRAFSVGLLR